MRSLTIAVILLALSGQVAASNSSAEDLTNLSIEELLNVEVISASRLGQKASLTPSSVSVLTAKDIRTFGWRTLADALNAMRGLYTSNDRNYSYLGVRGFLHTNDYNSRVLFMIDGQRMNENIFDGGYMAQEFMLDMDMVDHIEYIPGSGSSIYGANAFLGLINVVTKTGHAINGAQLDAQVGSYNTYKGRASYGKKLANGADILFSASHYDSAGVENLFFPEFDDPATNNGIAHNMDAERADRLFGRVQFKEFTLMGGYVSRFKRVPTASFGATFNDPSYHTVDQQFFGNLKYEKTLTDKTSVRLKGFYQGYDYHAGIPYDKDDGRVLNNDAVNGLWWGGEAQVTSTVFDGHRLMAGLEYQYDQRQHMVNFDIDPFVSNLNSNRQGNRVELYAQDDIQIIDDLIFSAGLRLDYHHMLKHLQLNPRLGLIWNPLASTNFKLLYSSTFRAPNVFERDYSFPNANTPNPNNSEERIKSYESVIEWHSTIGLKLIGDLFYNDISQLLEQNIDPDLGGANGQFLNIGNLHGIGAELEAEKRWDNGRLLKASYTYNHLTDETNGGIWAFNSPHNLFKLHYAEPLFNNFATLQFFNKSLNVAAFHKLSMENNLRHAIERDELVLYYQPKVNMREQRVIGCEALIRWQHPDFGLVPPSQFIPIAEDSGLIIDISAWVLETACKQMQLWQQQGLPPLVMAINVSANQFHQRGFVAQVDNTLTRLDLAPHYLKLELTESILLENIEDALVSLREFHALGIHISIDDFGTGYSSLAYLKKLPISELKIDRSFIQDIPYNEDDMAITAAILALAKSLSLEVVAEGVELEEQAAFLMQQGCEIAQGFLYSKPIAAAEFAVFVEQFGA